MLLHPCKAAPRSQLCEIVKIREKLLWQSQDHQACIEESQPGNRVSPGKICAEGSRAGGLGHGAVGFSMNVSFYAWHLPF